MSDPARKPEPKRRATYADLLAVPDHLVAEIIDGELVVSPRPAFRHAFASTVISHKLLGPFQLGRGGDDGPGGWWILFEPQLHLGDEELVPDLAGWRRERMPAFPDVVRCETAPDWVCEVVSPSTARVDRMKKMASYARARVSHAWLVDPHAQMLEVYRLEDDHWVVAGVYGGDMTVRPEPFQAVAFDLKQWWPPDAAAVPAAPSGEPPATPVPPAARPPARRSRGRRGGS